LAHDRIPNSICLAGADGAGKSTQADRLISWLNEQGRPATLCTIWDMLEQDSAGSLPFRSKAEIDRFLGSVHGAARAMFLHMAMREAIDRALDRRGDQILVVVGYWPKYNATERVYGTDPALLDGLAASFPELDLLIHLDLDPATSLARKQAISGYESAGKGKEGFIPFQTRLREVLQDLRQRHGGDRWHVVDGQNDMDTVTAGIRKLVTDWLERPATC
jgi:thymidylate kinase